MPGLSMTKSKLELELNMSGRRYYCSISLVFDWHLQLRGTTKSKQVHPMKSNKFLHKVIWEGGELSRLRNDETGSKAPVFQLFFKGRTIIISWEEQK